MICCEIKRIVARAGRDFSNRIMIRDFGDSPSRQLKEMTEFVEKGSDRMKINIQEIPGAAQTQKPLRQQNTPAGGFDQLLEKAMTPQSGSTSAKSAIPPLQSLSSLGFAVPTATERSQMVNNLNELLNVVESYQIKMADPKASLKEIYPLIQQMEKKVKELEPVAEVLPDGDKLKEILNRALVASTVEIIKFNRGDYV